MLAEQWGQMVAASVSPVVVISASALLSLALYNRLAAIITRLRAVQRERLQVQAQVDALSSEDVERGAALTSLRILDGLADQTHKIRFRARLIRNALLFLLAAIASLVICSLLTGLIVFWPGVGIAAAAMFACGLFMVLGSVSCAAMELIRALAPAELETDLVTSLTSATPRGRRSKTPVRH